MNSTDSRPPLSRERVLNAAVDLVDREGLGALTMRRLGAELSVEAMSLYKHVKNKDEILDGILETVISAIEVPQDGAHWKDAMRQRATSARTVLTEHTWAVGLLETRELTGPVVLRYVEAILGALRAGGFSLEDAGYAFWMLDSYVYGHIIQEANAGLTTEQEMREYTEGLVDEAIAGDFDNLAEVASHSLEADTSYDSAFEFGLDLMLDALERRVSGGGQ